MIYDNSFDKEDVNKISYILKRKEDLISAREFFPHLEVGTWGGANAEDIFGDFGIPNLDKARGIDLTLKYLRTNNLLDESSKSIAIGDGLNDISMLKKCDIGIAMGNSSEQLKSNATFITKEVQEDGLYHAFKKINLI